MLTQQQKQRIWRRVRRDFPEDEMMQQLHLIRGFMAAIEKRHATKSLQEVSELARHELIEWQKARRSRQSTHV